jgi:hypothetical protein
VVTENHLLIPTATTRHYPLVINRLIKIFIASDLILRWLFLLEEYGVTFKYLPQKKYAGTLEDALSHLDIESLKC